MKKIERYESVFMESFISDFKKSIQEITQILKSQNIKFTFIGGAARNQYGTPRTTQDVDILVSSRDKLRMLDLPIGFIRELSSGRGKRFKLHDPKTDIDVIYSGEISGGEGGIAFPDPEIISHDIDGIPYISLRQFIIFKLSSGLYGKNRKYKDFADVVDVIEKHSLKKDYLDRYTRKDIVSEYQRIWDEMQ